MQTLNLSHTDYLHIDPFDQRIELQSLLIRALLVLQLEGYRVPLSAMQNDTDKPEINQIHHVHLIQWALHKAFSVPDSEFFDPNRSALAEQQFTDYFGPRPDSDLRRITREDIPHNVIPFMP